MSKNKLTDGLKALQAEYAATREPMADTPGNRLAALLGWTWDGHHWFDPEGQLLRWASEPGLDSDLNAIAEAELLLKKRDRLAWGKYVACLADETNFVPTAPTASSMGRFATATAEQRCRAMLRALGQP